ncbi:hypothetical protein ACHAWF_007861 [Thalassiosira exigua]
MADDADADADSPPRCRRTGGGAIVLLDVPPGSSVTLDGTTRVTPAVPPSSSTAQAPFPFDRGLWIVRDVPPVDEGGEGGGFHMLVVRPSVSSGRNFNGGGCGALPVGFALTSPAAADPSLPSSKIAAEAGCDWIFARRYDPRTEEMSSEEFDDATLRNIVVSMAEGGEAARFAMSYAQFLGGGSHSGNNRDGNNGVPSWRERTSSIDAPFLWRQHNIFNGDKLVPSSEGADQCGNSTGNGNGSDNNSDGRSVRYPPIPCIDRSVNARVLARHPGTRAYISELSPERRTRLLFGGDEGADDHGGVWKDVLERHYGKKSGAGGVDGKVVGGDDFLADVELSFLLLLFLQCHASLEHWRDATSMCALSASQAPSLVSQQPHFFCKFLSILYNQLSCIETDFFREVEYSSGEDNFLVKALKRLCDACDGIGGKRKRGGDDGDVFGEELKEASRDLRHMVRDRFGMELEPSQTEWNDDVDVHADVDVEAMEWGASESTVDGDEQERIKDYNPCWMRDMEDGSSDEEDGPVVVPLDEVEASAKRASVKLACTSKRRDQLQSEPNKQRGYREDYPLLYAAMGDDEDEVMTCARILDEAKDASLVREAAAYLEEVEAHRGKNFHRNKPIVVCFS